MEQIILILHLILKYEGIWAIGEVKTLAKHSSG